MLFSVLAEHHLCVHLLEEQKLMPFFEVFPLLEPFLSIDASQSMCVHIKYVE